MKFAKITVAALPLLALFTVLGSCASTDLKLTQDPSIRLDLEPLRLVTYIDPLIVRETVLGSVVTQSRTETSRDSYSQSPVTTTSTTSNPSGSSFLAMDIGNGLLIDANKNIEVDILRLYQLEKAAELSLSEKTFGLFKSDLMLDLANGQFKTTVNGRLSSTGTIGETTAVHTEIGITGSELKTDLSKSTAGVRQDQVALGIPFHLQLDQISEVKVNFPPKNLLNLAIPESAELVKDSVVIKLGLLKDIKVSRNGKAIQIIQTDGLSKYTTTFFKTATGAVFFNDTNQVTEIRREDNTIKVLYNGKLMKEYGLQKLKA